MTLIIQKPTGGKLVLRKGMATWAEGGDNTYYIDVAGVAYRVHEFRTVGTASLNVISGGSFDYLIVAGGGRGGSTSAVTWYVAGGGGQVLQGTASLTAISHSVVVGAGASAAQTAGQVSSAFGFTASGGGAGNLAARDYQAGDSGSGNAGGLRSGTAGGGGGGNAAAGQNASSNTPGAGGNGTLSTINGQSLYYGGGGGGQFSNVYANEGLGGPSRANSGGGEGFAGTFSLQPARSGIVIVRYAV